MPIFDNDKYRERKLRQAINIAKGRLPVKIDWNDKTKEDYLNQPEEKKFMLIENGIYEMQIDKVEDKMPKNPESKAGEMVVVTFKITESGRFQNRLLWKYFCVNHESSKPAEIAKRDLKNLYQAARLGLNEPTSSLEGRNIKAEVMTKKDANGYPNGNDVVNYESSAVESVKKAFDEPIDFDDDSIPF